MYVYILGFVMYLVETLQIPGPTTYYWNVSALSGSEQENFSQVKAHSPALCAVYKPLSYAAPCMHSALWEPHKFSAI